MYTYDFFELMVLAIVFMAILLIIFFIYTYLKINCEYPSDNPIQ